VTWYLFTITTYGTNIPAGLFLPGMIIGCTLGNLLVLMVYILKIATIDDDEFVIIAKKLIILGCGSFMAGYTRMTYSLGVIMMETT
jgi:chloride channel 3/4/5